MTKKKILSAALAAALSLTTMFAAPAASAAGQLGDVDGNGAIEAADARLALRGSVGLETLTEEFVAAADVDKNGAVEASDARTILRVSVGLDKLACEHEYELEVIIQPDCTTTGLVREHCIICGEYGETKSIPTEHEWKTVEGTEIPATCTEDGFRKKLCEKCGEEADEVLPAGHVSSGDATCTKASVCSRCGAVLEPALGHDYDRTASITVTKGITCDRCGETGLPGFNDLVNVLKDGKHSYTGFTKTTSNFDEPKFSGIMLGLKSMFKKEFDDMIGLTTECSDIFTPAKITKYNFNVTNNAAVSLLTEADVASVKTEHVTGIDFVEAFPNFMNDSYGNTVDLTGFKGKEYGSVTKVTVTLKPENYADVADQGGSVVIDKIYSGYGRTLREVMTSMDFSVEGFMSSKFNCVSNATVVYYFDDLTNEPLAADYLIDMDVDAAMNMYIDDDGNEHKDPTGSIKFKIGTDINAYYFFDQITE